MLIGLSYINFNFFSIPVGPNNIIGFYLVFLWILGFFLVLILGEEWLSFSAKSVKSTWTNQQKVNGEDEAQIELQSGEWDSILAFDSLSHSFDQSYKLMKKTNDWSRPSDLISVLPQIG